MTTAELFTPEQTSKYIGIKRSTLDKWRHLKKHLAFVPIGGRIMYRKADLDFFITSRVVQPRSARRSKAVSKPAS